MLKTYPQLIKDFQSKGFNYIKIEMEASVHAYAFNGRGHYSLTRAMRHWGRLLKPETKKAIKYKRIYSDGGWGNGYGTEITFTIHVKDLKKLPEILEAYHRTCDFFGGYDVNNSGMHTTLMEGENYNRLESLPPAKIRNFRNSVNDIVNSLYVVACSGKYTRRLNARMPQVSDHSKYSAIYTHYDTCLEYRIFDPCYSNPKRLGVYLNLMSETLRYYSDIYVEPKLDGSVYPLNTDPHSEVSDISNLYSAVNIKRFFSELKTVYPQKRKLYKVRKSCFDGEIPASRAIRELALVERTP